MKKQIYLLGILSLISLSLTTACNQQTANTTSGGAPQTTTATATPIVQTANAADGDWTSYNRTLTGERFSPLNQITIENVGNLKQVCVADLGEAGNYHSGLIVTNNTLFAATDQNTYAIDPATCALKWKHTYEYTAPEGALKGHRGVAYSDGRVFRGIGSGALVAIDAATGKQVWETKIADMTKGESVPAAPIAWNGMIFIGQAGGDNKGVRGWMMAFNQSDGKQIWSFDLVPLTGAGADTWAADTPDAPRTGAATWTSYSLNPETGLLYVPTGNAAPDFDIKARPGKNLYSNSIVILDAKTGAFNEYYQLTPNDFHDWDVSAAPALINTAGGKYLSVSAGKDGFLHAIYPSEKREIYKIPVTTIENIDAPLVAGQEIRFCPGTQGGNQWNGPAFNPAANLIFVGAAEACSSVKMLPQSPPRGEMGKPFTGAVEEEQFGKSDPKEKWKGWLTAINADDGAVKWKNQLPTPIIAGVTTTAGNLVFTGDLAGDLMAFNAADGKQLWKQNAGSPIGGGVITYLANDKQYVAAANGLTSKLWQTKGGNAKVTVYALP